MSVPKSSALNERRFFLRPELGDDTLPCLDIFPAVHDTPAPFIVLIFPGGGYGALAEHEGRGYAQWLNTHGIDCAVLHYRNASTGSSFPDPMADAQMALSLLKTDPERFGLRPAARVGVIGSSAGGHLAATVSTLFREAFEGCGAEAENDENLRRPDFCILAYPVISLQEEFCHGGSRKNLLGDRADDPGLRRLLSPDEQVSDQTPPTFLWHTVEDAAVPVENSLAHAAALRRHRVPFELHVFPEGRHGLGIKTRLPWAGCCIDWLRRTLGDW